MHAIENGWYWLQKSLGDLFTEWPGDQSPEESFRIFCDHCRITPEEGKQIQDQILKTIALTSGIEPAFVAGKKKWVTICTAMFPRWRKEADDLIAKYHLTVITE